MNLEKRTEFERLLYIYAGQDARVSKLHDELMKATGERSDALHKLLNWIDHHVLASRTGDDPKLPVPPVATPVPEIPAAPYVLQPISARGLHQGDKHLVRDIEAKGPVNDCRCTTCSNARAMAVAPYVPPPLPQAYASGLKRLKPISEGGVSRGLSHNNTDIEAGGPVKDCGCVTCSNARPVATEPKVLQGHSNSDPGVPHAACGCIACATAAMTGKFKSHIPDTSSGN